MIRKGYRAPPQLALVLAGFAVVLVMSVVSIWLIRQSQATNERLTHALTMSNLIATMRADLRRTESGQRGFLLTSKAAYLNDYNAARGQLLPEIDQLERLAGQEGEARARAGTLHTLMEAKLDELGQTIELELTHRHEDALRLVATDEGLTLTQQITQNLEQIIAKEAAIIDAMRRSANRTDIALFAVNLAGVVLISALAYAAFLLFQRSSRRILASEREVRALNAELEARVAERTADLEEANAEIQRYAYIVTHDLRSPLVNIMGFTSELETLRDNLFRQLTPAESQGPAASGADRGEEDRRLSELRGDFDEAIHFIKTSIAKMDGLINAILKLSRAGRRELNIQKIDLNDLVEVIAGDFRHRLKEFGAEITIGELPTVKSDRMALEQIISNLIDNAIKYLRRDVPGQISVHAEETPTTYRIHVADNGRGIDARDRERVFELFRRAGPQDRPGEGIGLAHARGLARRIGGGLAVADNPGGGTVFTLALSKHWMARQSASSGGAVAAKGEAA